MAIAKDQISTQFSEILENQKNSIPYYGQFEREGSTYVWKLYRPGKNTLPGYSNPKGGKEKDDKEQLTRDIVRRLYRAADGDYVKRGARIEYFRAFTNDDRDNVRIFTLYENRFEIDAVAIHLAWLVEFLTDFYNGRNTPYSPDLFPKPGSAQPPHGKQIIPDRPAYASKDPYDETRRFKDLDALMNYVTGLLERKEPQGRVEDYYRKMSIKLRL